MKKLVCLLLMVWLPLFMGSAWAMNMQMALEDQQMQSGYTNYDVAKPYMSCHEAMDKTQGNQTHKTHQCLACGICALANASASFNTAPFFSLVTNQSSAPHVLSVAFFSQDYPPAYKPPILN